MVGRSLENFGRLLAPENLPVMILKQMRMVEIVDPLRQRAVLPAVAKSRI